MSNPKDRLPPNNDVAPHTAVIWVTFEVHQQLQTGELSGRPVEKGTRIFRVEGSDRQIALCRLNNLLEDIKRCSDMK